MSSHRRSCIFQTSPRSFGGRAEGNWGRPQQHQSYNWDPNQNLNSSSQNLNRDVYRSSPPQSGASILPPPARATSGQATAAPYTPQTSGIGALPLAQSQTSAAGSSGGEPGVRQRLQLKPRTKPIEKLEGDQLDKYLEKRYKEHGEDIPT